MIQRQIAANQYPMTWSYGKCSLRWSLAVRSGHDVTTRGGDVFQAFAHADGSFSAFLADVSSKGRLGILHAEMLRADFICSVLRNESPKAILTRLNRIRMSSAMRDSDVTHASAFVARFSPDAKRFTYASAGHELAMLFNRNVHRHLMPTGPIIGVISDFEYDEGEEPFLSSNLLVIATDGVSEARNDRDLATHFGSHGIAKALRPAAQTKTQSAADLVMRESDSFCGGTYRDDAMVAAIELANPSLARTAS